MNNNNTFDAIVIGSGISGGWAAKELCEAGLKTLVLERGRDIPHPNGYPTTNMNPWEFEHNGMITNEDWKNSPIQAKVYAYNESTKHFFVNDKTHEYITPEDKPYSWIRGYHVGGRSIMWGRQCYRWSDLDFEANAKDGHGIDWPIRYKDIEPWYDYVESFVGISGQAEGLPQLPDGKFIKPMEMNCVEKHVRESIKSNWEDRTMTIGRVANLTERVHGRGPCQFRNKCYTGCPYGGYFNSNSATLPAAAETGNMTLRPNSIVQSLIFDEELNKVTGVRVIDSESGEELVFQSKVVFVCASTIGSTAILMNSKSSSHPDGLGGNSGALGKYLMDHHYRVGATATFNGFEDKVYKGHRPNGIYVPRFRNVNDAHPDFIRGYGMQGSASRTMWQRGQEETGFGAEFKDNLSKPGPWRFGLGGWGEQLPDENNKIELLEDQKDQWGIPKVKISASFGENELKMRKDIKQSAAEMLEKAGGINIETYDDAESYPGFCIHEMGTARMGRSSKDSVLNKNNQLWDSPNVFVTDGACMTSSACQNPSITYMALTARAVNFAVSELKKNNL